MGTNFLNGYLYTNGEIYHINKIKEVTMEAKDSEEHEIKTEKIEPTAGKRNRPQEKRRSEV